MTCARCQAPEAPHRWWFTVCADGRKKREHRLCVEHDAELNALVLAYFGDPEAQAKVERYTRGEGG